jgi:mannobiose 2-epimerase
MKADPETLLAEIQDHLRDELLPFWLKRGEDKSGPGFVFPGAGAEDNPLEAQCAMISAFSRLHREGFGGGRLLARAEAAAQFVLDNYLDDDYGGWRPALPSDPAEDHRKTLRDQAYALLALGEYVMASGDYRASDAAVRTYETVHAMAADVAWGGFRTEFRRDWTPTLEASIKHYAPHLVLLQGVLTWYEATGAAAYARKAEELIQLLCGRMSDAETMLPLLEWTEDLQAPAHAADGPLQDDESQKEAALATARVLERSFRLMGALPPRAESVLQQVRNQCSSGWLDRERGGIWTESGADAHTVVKPWQLQANAMVVLLDAALSERAGADQDAFIEAYEAVHRFVMDHVIQRKRGTWRVLLDAEGKPLAGRQAAPWIMARHTLIAVAETEKRLLKLCQPWGTCSS